VFEPDTLVKRMAFPLKAISETGLSPPVPTSLGGSFPKGALNLRRGFLTSRSIRDGATLL
jgi:hypothetical protein